MKKSEMIRLLKEYFKEKSIKEDCPWEDAGYYSLDEYCIKELLNKIEQYGMMPPLVDGPAPLSIEDFYWEDEEES